MKLIDLYCHSNNILIELGDIWLKKENNKNESYCDEDKYSYHNYYHGIKNALCGKSKYYDYEFKGEYFTPKRILVIQMN